MIDGPIFYVPCSRHAAILSQLFRVVLRPSVHAPVSCEFEQEIMQLAGKTTGK